MSPVQAVPLLVPPAPSDVAVDARHVTERVVSEPVAARSVAAPPFAAPSDGSTAEADPPRPASRPNRFGAAGRQPGTHLPRTVVQQPAEGAGGIAVDVVEAPGHDAAAVKHSLSSFQSGTTQADQRAKTEEIAGTS
jgi:hypothetical protein